MTARTRTTTVEAPLRGLADKLGALRKERDAEGLYAGILEAALTATGAEAGRLERVDRDGVATTLVRTGNLPGRGPRAEREIETASGHVLRLTVAADEADGAVAGLLDVAVSGAQLALAAGQVSAALAGERQTTQRLAEALAALRYPGEPAEMLSTILEAGRALIDGEAVVMIAADAEGPRVAAQEGMDELSPEDVAELVPMSARRQVESGRSWTGRLPAGHPLERRGMAQLAVAPMGDRAALGSIAVVSRAETGVSDRELDALHEFAAHAAAAMTSAVVQREVRQLTAVDSVTRLFNGRYFAVRLDQEAQRAVRTDTSLSLAVLSLDGIAEMRQKGQGAEVDALLASLAAAIVPCLRVSDVAARIDDDELAVILPEAADLDAYAAAERLRTAIAGASSLADHTVSIGVASMPEQAEDGVELLDRSRSARVWAARHGGDRAFLYHRDTAAEMVADEREEIEHGESLLATLSALAATVDAQQPGARGHSERVSTICRLIAGELGLESGRVEQVAVAGMLHDVGKVGVSDELLAKETPLEPDEWAEMRRHSEIGHRMLSGGPLDVVREWVLSHHERLDGGGYPDGLVGDEIPLPARIIAAANAYDAMLSDRPYHPAMSSRSALSEMRRCRGTQFDSSVVSALETLVDRRAPGVPIREQDA